MFCPNCGFKNPDVACFCAKCGARLMYVGKSIRDRIAKENNIPYESSPCTNMDPCKGTCPACEAEAAALREMLKAKKEKGDSLYIHGENDLEAVNASPGDNLQDFPIPPWHQLSGVIPAEPLHPIRDSLLTRIKKAFGK